LKKKTAKKDPFLKCELEINQEDKKIFDFKTDTNMNSFKHFFILTKRCNRARRNRLQRHTQRCHREWHEDPIGHTLF
jgi:hypothetical protein